MRNLTVILIVIWLLALSLVQRDIIFAQRVSTRELMGHQADLMNLQEQIDHAYVRQHLPTHVDAATPTPVLDCLHRTKSGVCDLHRPTTPLVIRPKVGQRAPDEN